MRKVRPVYSGCKRGRGQVTLPFRVRVSPGNGIVLQTDAYSAAIGVVGVSVCAKYVI